MSRALRWLLIAALTLLAPAVVCSFVQPAGATPPPDTAYTAVAPCAVFDSRAAQGASGAFLGPINGNQPVAYDVTGVFSNTQGGGNTTCGIPDGAAAVEINLVAVNALNEGNLRVTDGTPSSTGGVVNYTALSPPDKLNTSNSAIIPLGAGGTIVVTPNCGTACAIDSTDVRGVVLGYFTDGLAQRVATLEAKLQDVTRVADGVGGQDTLVFSGMNVQIVDGSGTTPCLDGTPGAFDSACDGEGNLIVGYAEDGFSSPRNGSHNLIVGVSHGWTSYGGAVLGVGNVIDNDYASALGGLLNRASGERSAVVGGFANLASGTNSSVGGGEHNTASGLAASATGGVRNLASGQWAAVSGGDTNKATGQASSVTAGFSNQAQGLNSAVTGGSTGVASADSATVSGGQQNTASGIAATVSGGQQNQATGGRATVSGGQGNTAFGSHASVSGGNANTANGLFSSIQGGESNFAGAIGSSVVGGRANSANRSTCAEAADVGHTVVVGGRFNRATGCAAVVVGGGSTNLVDQNIASGPNSVVVGGWQNVASANASAVLAGGENRAHGLLSTVSGGKSNEATFDYAHVSGGQDNGATNFATVVSGGHLRAATQPWMWVAGGLLEEE